MATTAGFPVNIVGAALAAALSVVWAAPVSAAEVVDAVVAVVEGRPILLSELRDLREALAREGEAVTRPADLVERRIEDILVDRRAEQLGLAVSERDLDDAVQRIAGQNAMEPAELYAAVAAQGLDRDVYRRVLRDQIRRMRIAQREIEPRVRVDRADMLAWMRRHPERFGAAPKVALETIDLPRAEAELLAGCRDLPACGDPAALAAAAGPRLDRASRLVVEWPDLEGELQIWVAADPEIGAVRMFPGEAGRWLVVRFAALIPGELASLDAVQGEVEAEVRREKMDSAFRGWLVELKRDALIERLDIPTSGM